MILFYWILLDFYSGLSFYFLAALKLCFKDATEASINKCISDTLKYAPDKEGGGGRGNRNIDNDEQWW